jgi:hypothetical protein
MIQQNRDMTEARQIDDQESGENWMRKVAQLFQTCPADASDCTDREVSIAEVKRIRLLLHDYATKEKRQEVIRAELTARRSCGKIRLQYCHHIRLFEIDDGAISVDDVDEEFCLSDVMKGCRIELTEYDPKESRVIPSLFIEKHVRWNFDEGEWRSLYTYDPEDREPKKYWIIVIQDSKQRDKLISKSSMNEPTPIRKISKNEEGYFYGNNVGYVEGCSCLEGNPCTEYNKYNCKDWENRFAVALENS